MRQREGGLNPAPRRNLSRPSPNNPARANGNCWSCWHSLWRERWSQAWISALGSGQGLASGQWCCHGGPGSHCAHAYVMPCLEKDILASRDSGSAEASGCNTLRASAAGTLLPAALASVKLSLSSLHRHATAAADGPQRGARTPREAWPTWTSRAPWLPRKAGHREARDARPAWPCWAAWLLGHWEAWHPRAAWKGGHERDAWRQGRAWHARRARAKRTPRPPRAARTSWHLSQWEARTPGWPWLAWVSRRAWPKGRARASWGARDEGRERRGEARATGASGQRGPSWPCRAARAHWHWQTWPQRLARGTRGEGRHWATRRAWRQRGAWPHGATGPPGH